MNQLKVKSVKQAEFLQCDDTLYKKCPYCGQGKIPFKRGVCICGNQVGMIRYIQNPRKFALNCYSLGQETQGTLTKETVGKYRI